jgi:hypothetical protein
MKLKLWLLPFVVLSFVFMSATSSKIEPASVPTQTAQVLVHPQTLKGFKLNFIERFILKHALKKVAEVPAKADRQASTSLALGIAAAAVLLIGCFVPYVALVSLPLAIVAMTTGGTALRNGTSKESAARTGKGLGLGTIITFGALLIIGAILLATLFNNWG